MTELWDWLRQFLEASKEPISILGFVAQAVFFSRFAIQWAVSEYKRESVIPIGFWWCSLVGGLLMLVYTVLINAPPLILGQSFGVVVYTRNLMLVYRKRRVDAARATTGVAAPTEGVE